MTDQNLPRLTRAMIEIALVSIETESTPLEPFAITEHHGSRTLHRFATDPQAPQDQAAREFLRSDDAELAAIAWDGRLDRDEDGGEVDTDAVFVEAADRSDGASYVIAQAYGWRGVLRRRLHLLGEPVFVRHGTLLA